MSLQEASQEQIFRPDCENWLGYKPCIIQRAKGFSNCGECDVSAPKNGVVEDAGKQYDPEILVTASSVGIVEMGGLGSLLRTSAVTRAIQELNPRADMYLFTHRRGTELLKYIPGVIPVDVETNDPASEGGIEGLDVLINFELNESARTLCERANMVAAFAVNQYGNFQPASRHAMNFQRLQIDDQYRVSNTQNMQQILLESIGLDNSDPQYDLSLPHETITCAKSILSEAFNDRAPNRLIGLNLGTSEKGKLRRWSADSFAKLSVSLAERYPESGVVVLSGPDEKETREIFMDSLPKVKPDNLVVLPNNLEVGEFMGVVGNMNVLVTADTFALHVASAQDVRVVALTGPMPAKELELSPKDRIVGPKLACSPCYYRCGRAVIGECMQRIDKQEVIGEVVRVLESQKLSINNNEYGQAAP